MQQRKMYGEKFRPSVDATVWNHGVQIARDYGVAPTRSFVGAGKAWPSRDSLRP